jgi:hypothetical protein
MTETDPSTPAPAPWSRAETFGAALVVLLFWAALSWPWLSGALTIPWDAKAHFQPQLQFLAGSLARGEAPFWNPHVFAGHPQIADPQSLIFSPPHVIAAWLFPKPGMVVGDAVVLGMLLAGGLALLMLFRDRAWAPAGAVVAALVFAFGASAAWRIQHTGQIISLAWFAIALWLMSRALARRSARWGLAAGVAAGFMLLGRDQVALLGAYTLAGLTLAAWLQSGRFWRAVRVSLKPLTAMGFAAVLTAALPLLFTVLLAEQSNRPAIDLAGAGKGSLHPASLLTLFTANLFGAAGPLENFWGQPSPAWNGAFGDVDLFLARNMSVAYVGALPLLAILVVGLFRGRAFDPAIRAVSIGCALLLIYALGRYTPIFGVLHTLLPGVSLYRRPADALFNFGALAAILAGYCVHLAATETELARKRWPWIAAGLVVAAGLAVGLILAHDLQRAAVALTPTLIAAIVFVLGAVMLWMLPTAQRGAPLAAALFAGAVLSIDLAVSNGPSESTGLPSAQYDVLRPDTANETIAVLKRELARTAAPDRRDRVELAGVDFHWPNATMTHGLDHTLGYNPLRLGDFSRATGAGDHVALPDQRTFSALMPGYRSLLADMLGLRLIASRVPIDQVDRTLAPGTLPQIARTPDAFIFENSRALPRVMVAPRASAADFAAILSTGIWPRDFDPRQTVLLPTLPAPTPCNAAPEPTPAPSARIVSYANTRVEIAVTSPGCGWLVLNDAWQRWWAAEVNGEPEQVLKANVLFRAVAVPAGASTVVFEFAPFTGLAADIAARVAARISSAARAAAIDPVNRAN